PTAMERLASSGAPFSRRELSGPVVGGSTRRCGGWLTESTRRATIYEQLRSEGLDGDQPYRSGTGRDGGPVGPGVGDGRRGAGRARGRSRLHDGPDDASDPRREGARSARGRGTRASLLSARRSGGGGPQRASQADGEAL